MKRTLSEVYTRAVSEDLVDNCKMGAGDMVNIWGQVVEYTYIPTGMRRELVRSGVDCDWKG